MNKALIPDTNAVIAAMRGEQSVQDKLVQADVIYLNAIVLGELYYGAYHSQQVGKNIENIRAFAAGKTVLNCDRETAMLYGQITAQLRKAGTPIPQNDIWIAALALQHDAIVLTRDKHLLTTSITDLSTETY